MAELILSPIVGDLIDELECSGAKELGSLCGSYTEIRLIGSNLSLIKAVIVDAEKKQTREPKIRSWLESLEEALYETDNLLDDFKVEALRRTEMSGNYKLAKQFAFRFIMGNRVKEIRKKLDQIVEKREEFKLEKLREGKELIGGEERDLLARSSVMIERVIGRESDMKAILRLTLHPKPDPHDVSVIPIIGIGGLGKTALVRLLFNNEIVKRHFELKQWVCVSDTLETKQIIQRIAVTVLMYDPGDLGIDNFKTKLRDRLNGKCYLLVLDDFRYENHQAWLELEELFVHGRFGSRIIVTTRSEKVAGFVGRGNPYRLGALANDASWDLFKRIAFRQGQEFSVTSVARNTAIEIAKKCGGIPLVIRSIGGLMYYKNPETEWRSFYKDEIPKLSGNEHNFSLSALRLCYDHLPARLKQCFAFCARFGKDYGIDLHKLIQFWMARGFLKSSDSGGCLETVGNKYFLDLFSRSFFHQLSYHDGDKIQFKMQNLAHDLALSITGLEIDRSSTEESLDLIPNSTSQQRRLGKILLKSSHFPKFHGSQNNSLNFKNIAIISSNFKFLRSLDLSHSGIKVVPDSICKLKHLRYLDLSCNDFKILPSSFTELRNLLTLDISHSGIKMLPRGIGKLKRLRFLDLSYSKVTTLPDSVGTLEDMVTLNLCGCKDLTEWFRGVENLINLKHLDFYGSSLTSLPCGLSQLTNLETLMYFPLRFPGGYQSYLRAQVSELAVLNKLRGSMYFYKLRLKREAEYRAANLKAKKKIESLMFSWALTDEDSDDDGNYSAEETYSGPRMLLEGETDFSASYERSLEALEPHLNLKKLILTNYGAISFPSWLPLLTSLHTLSLNNCPKFQYLSPLKQLISLKTLILNKLTNLLYVSENGECESVVLSSLEYLKMSELPNFQGWCRPSGDDKPDKAKWNLPTKIRFQRVGLMYTPSLQYLPPLRNFQSLKTLILHHLAIMYVSYDGETESFHLPSPLPLLEHLEMSELPNLRGWWKPISSNVDDDTSCSAKEPKEIPVFPRLLQFHLQGTFSGLNSMPLFPHLRDLTLTNTKLWNPFNLVESTNFTLLSKLRRLSLVRNTELHCLPDWLKHLSSLDSLFITECPKFKCLSPCIQHLKALKRLEIRRCGEFDPYGDSPELWRPLTSLQFLTLAEVSKVIDLPSGIQYATNLEELKLEWCLFLKSIPEWIGNLGSLRVLSLSDCWKLKTLPEAMRELKSLVKLNIKSCQMLTPRCRRKIGQDWSKIAHIPEIVLDLIPSKFDEFRAACSELLA